MHATHKLLSVNMAPIVSLKGYRRMLLLPQELGNNHIQGVSLYSHSCDRRSKL